MKRSTIIFRINLEDKKDSFAKASNFISKFSAKETIGLSDIQGVSSFECIYDEWDYITLAKHVWKNQDKGKAIRRPEKLSVLDEYDVYFCLWINTKSMRDVVDFQYDYLMKKFFAKEKIFSILIADDSDYYKISHYLYSMSCADEAWYNSFFCWKPDGNNGKLIRLQKKNVYTFNKFMPLQYFSKEHNFIRQKMNKVVEKQDLLNAIQNKKYDLSTISEILRGSIGILQSACKQIDLEREDAFDEIVACYREMLEITISCEQLMENVVNHSEAKAGGITIRFHEGNAEYLSERYHLPESSKRYIEILITDYAGINVQGNIAQNFLEKLPDEGKMRLQGLRPVDFFPDSDDCIQDGTGMWKQLNEYNISPKHIGKHIGLKVFQKVIEENNGQFGFYSHKTHEVGSGENLNFEEYTEMGLPGTGYTVLFPIDFYRMSSERQTQISIDVNIDLETNICDYVDGYACREIDLMKSLAVHNTQEEKEAAITKLAQIFSIDREEKGKRHIVYICAQGMDKSWAEYICKALIIASFNDRSIPDYVFYDCSKPFVHIFQTTLLIYWENKDLMQMYRDNESVIALYTEKPITSWFVVLGNRGRTIWANKVNCYSECEYIDEKWLGGETNSFTGKMTQWEEIPPYDILYTTKKNQSTIFEQYTIQILENDIQGQSFGCKLFDTHMRLGSTIHIDSFYEAELLFSNRLFANRFAYLLIDDIIRHQDFIEAAHITLYSYALYSESLVVEMVDLLSTVYPDKDIDYVILEREAEVRGAQHIDRIRYGKGFETEEERRQYFKDRKIICIVPINSTMKTHEKLLSLFVEKNGIECEKNVILNYALILIGSKGENRYWTIDKKNKTFGQMSLKIQPTPKYFIEVMVEYYEANSCALCFPKKSMDELPLIEVNAASTIPNQSFRLYESNEAAKIEYSWISAEEKKIEELKDVLVYKHVCRGENHFQYYFRTDLLFLKQKEHIVVWLKKIADRLSLDASDYHILFCPAHYSNAGFVENINRIVFRDAALLIRVDIDKEYRSNVCAKYSNLTSLIDVLQKNLSTDKTIHIYYVDDSIITGRTFYRAKSLVSSIVQQYKKRSEKINIHVFEKIFILLDRNSKQSILQYIGCWDSANKNEEQLDENFFVYKSVNIPSMRSHGDSCVLCKLERDAKLLYSTSATQNMIDYWKRQQKKFSISQLRDNMEDVNPATMAVNQEKAFRRMVCYHLAQQVLLEGKQSNRKVDIIKKVLELLIVDYEGRSKAQGQDIAFEYLLSYLKIISRPFIVFDKAVKEAIFDIQLILSEAILSEKNVGEILKESDHKNYLFKEEQLWEQLIENIVRMQLTRKQTEDLLKLLMKQLTEMKSNYFIRIENIKKMSQFVGDISSEADKEVFYERFLQQTKKLLGVSSDTSKSAWFSKQTFGREAELGLSGDVLGRLLLENTRAYYDGIKRLSGVGSSLKNEITKPQYRDFFSVLEDMGYVVDGHMTDDGANKVEAAISLLKICNSDSVAQGKKLSEGRVEELCKNIVQLIARILGAKRVQLLLECPLECDLWEDRLKTRYNEMLDNKLKIKSQSDEARKVYLPLNRRKEYSVIASSKTRNDGTIENAEISVVKRIEGYYQRKRESRLEGVYVDEKDKFMIWEIGNNKHQLGERRKLLIYVEFHEVNLPTDWHKIRNLLCMNYEMHRSVFSNEVINYLFELLLADKRRMINEREKAHSHTDENAKIAQCKWVRENQEQSAYRSFVLTLLSDLMISEVYRNSLKDDYYNQAADFQERGVDDVFSIFQGEATDIKILDSKHTNLWNNIQVELLTINSFFDDDQKLDLHDKLISYAIANGENEIFLLVLALILNAGVAGRGKKEDDYGKIKVYISKTQNGNLRIANKSEIKDSDIEEINERLHYPPQKNQGISLWSVSRYIKAILSILIEKKLNSIDENYEGCDGKCKECHRECKKSELLDLGTSIKTYMSEEYDIRVCRKVGIVDGNEANFFCIDVPLYREKYSKLWEDNKK